MGDEFYGKEYDDFVAPSSAQRIIYNLNLGGNKMTQDSSETNHVQGAFHGSNFSGNIGGSSNTAKVGGNQSLQNNNANTAELLKLISSMRQTADRFPEDIREGIIIDIEDVEAEINKPENQRNKTKLNKRLTAILAAATAIGLGIPGAADFANTAIDLGQKMGIELNLPPGR
jgi:internalin A